jgi:signal transduction histidine kinase/ActR/RegA family two-component response regulator
MERLAEGGPQSERVLILAPVGRDAALTASLLAREGREAHTCPSVEELVREISRGAGLAILTEDVLNPETMAALSEFLRLQPAWSDFPVLVFTSGTGGESAVAQVLTMLRPLGNVSLLERPVRVATLVSAVEAALRARRRQYEVCALLEELQAGVRQRDEFLAMLGHELRNPLSAMLMAAYNLEAAGDAASATEMAARQRAIVRRQGQILSRLVDDLLEVARVTTGRVALQKTRTDLVAVVKRGVEAVTPLALQQGLAFDASTPHGALWVDGDPTRLEQVLSNLLTNAIKYTPAGGRIEVVVAREGEQAVLRVRDTGVGIEPEVLPRIFELFRQADRTLNRAMGGLGIGLTLVRTLVEMHGGVVAARSEGLGRGSEFVVRLPVAPTGERRATRPPLSGAAATGRRVFVLEDNADNREALVFLLQQLGHEIHWADEGILGAERIVQVHPELALIDIGLPGIDGYEVARRVRGALGTGIVLVAVTGYGQQEDEKRAMAAGFDLHMSKPIDVARLRRLLELDAKASAVGG